MSSSLTDMAASEINVKFDEATLAPNQAASTLRRFQDEINRQNTESLQLLIELFGTGLDIGGDIAASGNVGIGTDSPEAKLHIDAGDNHGLIIKTDEYKNIFQYLKEDDTNLLRALWDGYNFHHYMDGHIYQNLRGYIHTFHGNGNTNSAIRIAGSASLKLDPDIDGGSDGIHCGDFSYATEAIQFTTNYLLKLSTWAYDDGLEHGRFLRSDSYIGQKTQSYAHGDARLFIENDDRDEVLSIDLPTGNVVSPTYNYGPESGAADAYVVTMAPVPIGYATGMQITFIAGAANTGAATVNVNSLGAKALKRGVSTDPGADYIKAGSAVVAVYDGTNFQMIQPAAQ